jgi:hypothetical protein
MFVEVATLAAALAALEAGHDLDIKIRCMEAQYAGALLAPCATGMFYVSDEEALEWFKERPYAPKIGDGV